MSEVRHNTQGLGVQTKGEAMWDTVGIVAAVVVIVLLIQLLDVAEALKVRLKGGLTNKDLEQRMAELERRIDAVEKKGI